jgi:hypothetical protein
MAPSFAQVKVIQDAMDAVARCVTTTGPNSTTEFRVPKNVLTDTPETRLTCLVLAGHRDRRVASWQCFSPFVRKDNSFEGLTAGVTPSTGSAQPPSVVTHRRDRVCITRPSHRSVTLRARMHTKGGAEFNACCYGPINQEFDRLTAPGGKRTVRVEGKSRRKPIVPVGSVTNTGTLTLHSMGLGLAWSWNERGKMRLLTGSLFSG